MRGRGAGRWPPRWTQAAGAPIEWEIIDLVADETGNVRIDDAVDSLRRNKVGLKGTVHAGAPAVSATGNV